MTTVSPAASSHTVQLDSSAASGVEMFSGAPGMPNCGPRWALSTARWSTMRGSAGVPAINRAEAMLNTGCSASPIWTYVAPLSRTTTIAASPISPAGLTNARIALTANMTAARIPPTANEIDCARIGSSSMRVSPRTSACSIRRTRNRYPLTCSRVVGCNSSLPLCQGNGAAGGEDSLVGAALTISADALCRLPGVVQGRRTRAQGSVRAAPDQARDYRPRAGPPGCVPATQSVRSEEHSPHDVLTCPDALAAALTAPRSSLG